MTARVVLPSDATREEWLFARRAGIGGSDIGALLGASPFTTPLDVWVSKTMDDITPENEAMRVGSLLEPGVIALGMAHLNDTHPGGWWLDDSTPALLAHPDHPVAQYSPDGIAHGANGSLILEAKVTSKHLDEPSPHWVAQVQWGMGITGLDQALIVAVNGSRPKYWMIDADEQWFGNALDYAESWWTQHIINGELPEADPARDDLTIFRTPDPDLAVEVSELLVANLEAARQAKKDADAAERDAAQRLKAALGDATAGTINGAVRVTWKPSTRTDIDRDAMKADGLWDKYAVTKPVQGALRVVKP